ncbi:MAG: starch-binding protein [Prevotella sp.]|nr:starch-binding protein [Prevotella sp.]
MKKFLTLFVMLMAFAVTSFAQKTVYLSPGVWSQDGARFAVWSWSDGDEGSWTDMTLVEGKTDVYQATLPEDATSLVLVRMNGSTTENSWDNKWNQTEDITGETAFFDKALYTITGWGSDKSPYEVSTYTDEVVTPEQPETYAIVGELTGGWEADVVMTQSTDDENVYTLVVDEFTAEAKTYQYKLRANGKWGVYEIPAVGNQEYTFEEAGNYKLTFTANVSEHTLALAAEKMETPDVPAEITKVQLLGDWNWNTGVDNVTLTKGDGNVWTGVLDLSEVSDDQKFKLVVNGGGDESDGWKGWIGTNNLTVDAPESWVVSTADEDNQNCVLNNATTGYQTYNLTAMWTPGTDYAAGWTLKIEGKDVREVETIETYAIVGELTGGWEADVVMTQSTDDENIYTLVVDEFTAEAKTYQYKLRANGKWGLYEIPAVGNQEYTFEEAGNYKLTFTANVSEHTLALVAEKIETPTLNTYTATFDNGGQWEEVYAYAWTETDGGVTEFLGAWPGTKLEAVDGVYTVTIEAEAAPEKIIFSNGKAGDELVQTEDLTFEDGKAYTYTVPVEPVLNTYTATFDNGGQWEEVYAYAWTETDGDVTEFLGAWPGTKLEAVEGVYTVTIEAEAAPEKIIFSNGKAGDELVQTEDLTFEDGKAYTYTVPVEPVLNTYTATFDNGGQWEEVYAYAWTETDGGVTEFLGAWPGTKLEAVDGVYTVTIEAEAAPEKIIFSNGKSGDELVQTEDLTFEDGKVYTYTAPVEPDAEINTVQLLGDWNWNVDVDNVTLTKGDGNVWTGVLDLSEVSDDQKFKLVVNGGGDESDGWKGWIGTNNLTVDAPENWVVSTADEDNQDCMLNNATTGYQTYYITATWTPGTDYAAGWTLKIEGKDVREVEAIETYGIVGDFSDWDTDLVMTQSTDNENIYTLVIDEFTAEAKAYEYKLRANGKWGLFELPAEGNNSYTFEEAGNYKLTFTANVSELTLTLVAEKIEEPVEPTYTATFDNGGQWEEVYAYAWSTVTRGDAYEPLGAWPGTKMVKEGDTYTITFESEVAPEFIVFNDGQSREVAEQTEALTFTDGEEYTYVATFLNTIGVMDRDVYYDLSGRRVETPAKGIYIRNGKNVVMK